VSPRSTPPTDSASRRGLGLDKPCTKCGQEIYFGYDGPFEGLCGRCTDVVVSKKRRVKRERVLVEKSVRSGPGWIVVFFAFLAGAAAGILAYPFLGL